MAFLSFADFFNSLLKNYVKNTTRMSNSLDPDQVQLFIGPDLGPNCLQRLLADDTSTQRVQVLRL